MFVLKIAGKKHDEWWHYLARNVHSTSHTIKNKEAYERWRDILLQSADIMILIKEEPDLFVVSDATERLLQLTFIDEAGQERVLLTDSDAFMCSESTGETLDVLQRGKPRLVSGQINQEAA